MSDSVTRWQRVARGANGEDYAHRYAAHFDRLEESGKDIHGEAALVTTLAPPGARVLDAGCGTGRVAARLAALGYDVVGADVDPAMIAVARERSPELSWQVTDLAGLDLGTAFEVIVSPGNVIPFVPLDSLAAVATAFVQHLALDGLVVCGFGLTEQHLPAGAPVVPLAAYDEAWSSAGLELVERFAGWDRAPYDGGAYAVSLHRRR